MISSYRPQKSSKTLFLTEISELLSICSIDYDRTLISGDANLHVDNDSDAVAMNFLQLLHPLDFIQHVTGPTHELGHTLDLVISKGICININRTINKPELSDHCLLCFNMSISDLGKNNREITIKKFFLLW